MKRFLKQHVYERGFIRISRDLFKRKPLLIIPILLIAPILAVSAQYLQYTFITSKNYTVDIHKVGTSSTSLSVLAISPRDQTSVPKKITFTFSEEVDPHTFEHFFYISPEVTGKIQKGRQDNTLEFIPNSPFKKSVNYSLKIGNGLSSINGKLLLSDEYSDFTTELERDSVRFVKDNIYGRVLSFPVNKPVAITIQKSDDIETAKISIYRSSQANLLNYLVYENVLTDEKYKIYNEQFKVEFIDHPVSSRIQSFVMKETTEEKKLTLQPGIYYFEAEDEEVDSKVGSAFIIVNSVGVLARQDDKKFVLSSFDVTTNRTLTVPSTVGFYNLDKGPNQIAVHTYSDIESRYPMSFSQRVDAIIGTIKGETIFVPLKLPNSFADIQVSSDLDTNYEIMVYTDRPIYKPGDTVYFRGIVRRDSDSLYSVPPAGTSIHVWLGYGENPSISMYVPTDTGGAFNGQFVAPKQTDDNFTTEYLYASADLDAKYYAASSAYFDIVSYKKPTFELKTNVNKAELIRNEQMKFAISGNYFDQRPLANQEVTYAIYAQDFYEPERAVYNANFNVTASGGMCGGGFSAFEEYYGTEIEAEKSIKLDSQGKAEISFTLPASFTRSQTVTLVAKKRDGSNDIVSATKTIVHGADQNIFFMPSAQNYSAGEEIVAPFYAEMLTGEKLANQDLIYKLVTTQYYYEDGNSSTTESTVASGNVKTDSDGRGIVTVKLPENIDKKTNELSKYLFIEGRDKNGNRVEARKYIAFIDRNSFSSGQYSYWQRNSTSQTYLNIRSSKSSYIVGDTIILDVRSPKELDVLLSLERGRVYQPRIVHLNKGDNTVRLAVDNDLSPSITAVFSFFADGQYYTEGVVLNIPAMHKLLDVQVISDKTTYGVDETANLRIVTLDAFKSPVRADFSLSVVDKAIYALRKNATPPVHSSFYYFRPRRTNASSSLTWVGTYDEGGMGGGGGGGGSSPINVVDTLYWNPNLTTDATGEVTVSVPLKGNASTWQAQVIASTEKTDLGQGSVEFTSIK